MSDLQATYEFSIELYKFYNVDLFQRGLYQVRIGLRVSPKLPVHIEASVTSGSNNPRTNTNGVFNSSSLVGELAASRAFHIMYRNEEVTLRDIVHFRAHLLVDSRNLKESLERAEWSIGVELWCGENAQSTDLSPVSCRVLKLHFQPSNGLHYHLPVIFDYFHLCAVSVTIHVSLVALHQPYIKKSIMHYVQSCTPRSGKQWSKLMKNTGVMNNHSGAFDNVIFGVDPKYTNMQYSKTAHARLVHAEVCAILLGSLEGLQNALTICGSTGTTLTPDESSNSIVGDVSQRLKDLAENRTKNGDCTEEQFAGDAAQDIARLCAEVTVRWRAFLHTVADRPHVHHALAARHHALRIKRFSECFFVLDNPRHSLAGCYDSNYQSYQSIGEAARRSRYLSLLPPLPVHCIGLDGDPHIMPIIFEDRYQDTAEFARRRSFLNSNNNEISGSDPFLCSDPIIEDCSCTVNATIDRPASEASKVSSSLPRRIIDALDPVRQKHNVIEAKLTIAPQKSLNNSPKKTLAELTKQLSNKELTTRYIVQNNQINEIKMSEYTIQHGILSRPASSTILESRKFDADLTRDLFKQKVNNVASTLPARHSKSLDQLRVAQMIPGNQNLTKTCDKNKSMNVPQYAVIQPKPTTLPRTVANSVNRNTRTAPKDAEYQRNIKEFREKYKNPCNVNPNPRSLNAEIFKMIGYKYDGILNYRDCNYAFSEQGNNGPYIPNPLDFERGHNNFNLPRPMLPPRNSYPPVSKNQTEQSKLSNDKQIHRSNSTHVFHQNGERYDYDKRDRLTQELNYYLQKDKWSYDHSTNSLVHHTQKKSSKSSDDSGFVMTLDRSSDGTSKSTYSKTPPSTPHSSNPSTRQKKTKPSVRTYSKENSRIHSSKDSLNSHHSVLSKESKSDRATPKSDRATPKSGRNTPKTNGKRSKHKPSEKMSQFMSEAASSSSDESIPFTLKRLESSASVPYRLDQGAEIVRNCRSAASVLDEPNVNSNIFSESLPNLAPPPAFDSPLLDIADKDFQILPPETFKNKSCSSSTSSLSEQSGWVSSGRSSGRSSPEKTNIFKNYNTYPDSVFRKSHNKGKNCEKVNEMKRSLLNSDQLRQKLMKLAIKVAQGANGQIECCDKIVCKDCTICSGSICTDTHCEYNKLHNSIDSYNFGKPNICLPSCFNNDYPPVRPPRHNSFSAVSSKINQASNEVKKSPTVSDNLHPYIRKEIPNKASISNNKRAERISLKHKIEYTEKLLAEELKNITIDKNFPKRDLELLRRYTNKLCRSYADLTRQIDNEYYEELRLPPPQQFRDGPPPPDAFRDSPSSKSPKSSRVNSKSSTPKQYVSPSASLQLDNPLYHVCEGALERRKLRPQSSNSTTASGGKLNKSQSTGELAGRNEGDHKNDLVSIFGLAESERLFVKCRDEFRQSVKYPGSLYSDFPPIDTSLPYFHISDEYRMFNPEGLHLIICVHGLDGNSNDLRLVKTYLELGLPGARLDFLMSERNQGDTFSDFDTMTDRLVQEIMSHIQTSGEPARISFVGHSLGTIIIRSALARPQMKQFLGKLHTFLSLSGPHLGTLYNSSGLVNAGLWFMQKWKKSGSLLQLSLRDASDPRQSFLYNLSERSQLHQFKHLLLCGSGQDRYVPLHSARLELCKAAAKDNSLLGQAYREMVHNMVSPLASPSCKVSVIRYDVQHALPHTASALVGRAAHIAALDSDLFIEKFLLVSALKYFR